MTTTNNIFNALAYRAIGIQTPAYRKFSERASNLADLELDLRAKVTKLSKMLQGDQFIKILNEIEVNFSKQLRLVILSGSTSNNQMRIIEKIHEIFCDRLLKAYQVDDEAEKSAELANLADIVIGKNYLGLAKSITKIIPDEKIRAEVERKIPFHSQV
ncbi:MAG: hypothetical protein COT84_05205 [Chlamydiae bacterium CG10_big_fil_rev_8_21_14_0_10_35_9]|nr:MAG: hypothetical protein COT84_05205 [Chlamydiae bacterium CG10_big_fil_rev_8_21_14_0_10_35_9]